MLDKDKLEYVSSDYDFRYYWNIIRSNRFVIEGTKAMEVNMQPNIDKFLVPHFKIYFYDELRNLVDVVFMYPDERNKVETIIKVPKNAVFADFSIWTISTPAEQYTYKLDKLRVSDISNNVKPVDYTLQADTKCIGDCIFFARVLKSQLGGMLNITVGDKAFGIDTSLPEAPTHDEEFVWVNVGEINNQQNDLAIKLENIEGFNSLNAMVFLTKDEAVQMENSIESIRTQIAAQQIAVEDLTPVRGPQTDVFTPVNYFIQNTGGANGKILAFAKLFNPNWQIEGHENVKPHLINGYINGWDINDIGTGEVFGEKAFADSYTIKYKPQRFFYIGAVISGATVGVLVMFYGIYKVIKYRKHKVENEIHWRKS